MKEFQAVFQLSKTIIFEVRYYTLSTNKTPHFSFYRLANWTKQEPRKADCKKEALS